MAKTGEWEPIDAPQNLDAGWEPIQANDAGWEPIDSGGRVPEAEGAVSGQTVASPPGLPATSSQPAPSNQPPPSIGPAQPVAVAPMQDFGSPRMDALVAAAAEQPGPTRQTRMKTGEIVRPEAMGPAVMREAGRAMLPTVTALAGGIGGAKVGLDATARSGNPVVMGVGAVGGTLVGAWLAGAGGQKAQDRLIVERAGELGLTDLNRQMEANRRAYPLATLAGELIPQALTMRVNTDTLRRAGRAAALVLRGGKLAKADIMPLVDTTLGAGTAAGTEAWRQIQEGDLELPKLLAATLAGAAFNDIRGRGPGGAVAPAGGAPRVEDVPVGPAAQARTAAAGEAHGADLTTPAGRMAFYADAYDEITRALKPLERGGRADRIAYEQMRREQAEPATPRELTIYGPTPDAAAAEAARRIIAKLQSGGKAPAAPKPAPIKSLADLPDVGMPEAAPVQPLEVQPQEVTNAEVQGAEAARAPVAAPEAGPGGEPTMPREVSTAGPEVLPETGPRAPEPNADVPTSAAADVGPAPAGPETPRRRPKGPEVLGDATQPPTRSYIDKLDYVNLKGEVKRQKDANGIPLWETQADRSAAGLRRRLKEHRAWYMDRAGLKERAPLSPETKAKMAETRAQRLQQREWQDWEQFSQYEQAERAKLLADPETPAPGAEVFVGDEDAVYRVVDVVADVSIPTQGNAGAAKIRGWRFVVSDGNQLREVPRSELKLVEPENVDAALAAFDFMEGRNDEGVQGAAAAAAGGDADAAPAGSAAGRGAGESAGGGEPFALEGLQPGQLEAERAAAGRRSEVAARQAAPLRAAPLDTTADLFGPTEGATPLFNQRRDTPQQDLADLARRRQQEGSIRLPSGRRAPSSIKAWAKSMFSTTRGLTRAGAEAAAEFEFAKEYANLQAGVEERQLELLAKGLARQFSRKDVLKAIGEYQEGLIDEAGFAGRFGLAPAGREVSVLMQHKAANAARADQIADWEGLSADSRAWIRQNVHYQTRRYLRHVLGEDFEPSRVAVQDAIHEVETGLANDIAELEAKASSVRGVAARWDVIGYLQTGDDTLLAGLAPTRADAARAVLDRYRDVRDVIAGLSYDPAGNVVAMRNARALRDVAAGVVDWYLTRDAAPDTGGGAAGVGTGNLQQRFLEPVFRALYGEITDPVARQRATAETQGRMLAQMTLMNRIFADVEGSLWAVRPDPAKRFTVRLGDKMSPQQARMRFGALAGRYVTPDVQVALEGPRNFGKAWELVERLYVRPMGVWRLTHLALSPKTLLRNGYSSILGNALATGDIFNPTFFRHWSAGHEIAVKAALKDPAAMATMAEMAQLGVFRADANSLNIDLQIAQGSWTKGLPQKVIRKLTRFYGTIDFMTKYAAYKSNVDPSGRYGGRPPMTHEGALANLRDHYQNRDRVPRIMDSISKAGVGDFTGYTADAMRFTVNQAKHAAAQVAAGNPVPMAGFLASRALWYAAFSTTAASLWAAGHQAMRRAVRDENEDGRRQIELLPDSKRKLFRMLLPSYDRFQPLTAWMETKPNGKKEFYYTILGGQQADPAEDWIMGALQSKLEGGPFLEALGRNASEQFGMAGYPAMWWRLAVGRDLAGKTFTARGEGLTDVYPFKTHPNTPGVLRDAAEHLAIEMAGGNTVDSIRRVLQMQDERASGKAERGLFARTDTVEDNVVKIGRLVRTYRIERSDMNRRFRDIIRDDVQALRVARGYVSGGMKEQLQTGGLTADEQSLARRGQLKNSEYIQRIGDRAKDLVALAPDWYDQGSLKAVLQEAGMDAMESELVALRAHGAAIPQIPYIPNPMRVINAADLMTVN